MKKIIVVAAAVAFFGGLSYQTLNANPPLVKESGAANCATCHANMQENKKEMTKAGECWKSSKKLDC